jgi:hypothetical protein
MIDIAGCSEQTNFKSQVISYGTEAAQIPELAHCGVVPTTKKNFIHVNYVRLFRQVSSEYLQFLLLPVYIRAVYYLL